LFLSVCFVMCFLNPILKLFFLLFVFFIGGNSRTFALTFRVKNDLCTYLFVLFIYL
jgi:hypothetical protein